jgi:hypothetical protein
MRRRSLRRKRLIWMRSEWRDVMEMEEEDDAWGVEDVGRKRERMDCESEVGACDYLALACQAGVQLQVRCSGESG